MDDFLSDLRKMARTCEFAQLEDSVRDRIIIGIGLRDKTTRRRLLQITRSSADADNRLDALSGQSRSTSMVPFHMLL